jgi:hypothetical protein
MVHDNAYVLNNGPQRAGEGEHMGGMLIMYAGMRGYLGTIFEAICHKNGSTT